MFIPERKCDAVIVVLFCISGMIGKCVLCYYVIMPLLCRYYVIMPLLCYYIMQLLCYCVVIMFSTDVFYKHAVV
jgi:cell division protein FtsW (lipid II flippase)